MNLKKTIIDTCNKHIDSRIYIDDRITNEKLLNAKTNYKIPSNEEVLVLIDGTMLGGCERGLALCESGLFWKNLWSVSSNKFYLTWDEFLLAEIKKYDSYEIQIGRGNIYYTCGIIKEELLIEIFCEIQENLSKNIIERNNEQDKKKKSKNLKETTRNYELNRDFKEWYIGYSGNKYGPYRIKEIYRFINEKNFEEKNVLVWKKGMKEWKNLRYLDEVNRFKDVKESRNIKKSMCDYDEKDSITYESYSSNNNFGKCGDINFIDMAEAFLDYKGFKSKEHLQKTIGDIMEIVMFYGLYFIDEQDTFNWEESQVYFADIELFLKDIYNITSIFLVIYYDKYTYREFRDILEFDRIITKKFNSFDFYSISQILNRKINVFDEDERGAITRLKYFIEDEIGVENYEVNLTLFMSALSIKDFTK